MKRKHFYRDVLFSVIFWVFVTFYFLIVRFIGVVEGNQHVVSATNIVNSFVGGFMIGLILGLYESSKWMHIYLRKSLALLIILKTIIYCLFFLVVIFFIVLLGQSLEEALDFLFSVDNLALLIHLSFFSLLFHFIRQMSKKFGPEIFMEYMTGKYFHPKEERRVFMFLDLKSSTTIAEKIGHIAYSELIQDCFALLTKPLLKYNAQVYQYVGDEIVVTWKINQGFEKLNCIHFFFAYIQKLENKKQYFLDSYGIFPQFKAGMDAGLVTVAEVGEIKSEIAYHGDTLNTAARIQGLCNDYNEQFLASEIVINAISQKNIYKTQFIDNLVLRGKENKVRVFNIEEG